MCENRIIDLGLKMVQLPKKSQIVPRLTLPGVRFQDSTIGNLGDKSPVYSHSLVCQVGNV